MELEIISIEENNGFNDKQGEIRALTRVALTDSIESQRLRAIRRLENIFNEKGFKLISGFQADNQLMLRYQNIMLNHGIYCILEKPRYEKKPIRIHPFLISERGALHTNYKRCGFEELK